MRLAFVGIDPDTDKDSCPAMFIDEESGDFVFQGLAITDPQALAQAARYSPLGSDESVIRLPARMKQIIREAAGG